MFSAAAPAALMWRVAFPRPSRRQLARHPPLELRRILRELDPPSSEPRLPFAVTRGPSFTGIPARVDLAGDLEGRVRPPECFACARDLVVAERRAMCGRLARLVRRTEPDDRLAAQQRRAIGGRERFADCRVDRSRVVAVDAAHHVPAVGFEPSRGVVGEPPPDLAVDGNVVVVIERDQLAEAQRSRERAGLVRDAFHQAAVADEHPRAVIDDRVPVPVEARRQHLLRDCHADGVRKALPEWSGGRLDPWCVAALGVPRGHRMELPEALDLVERQRVTAEMEKRVEEHRTVPVREHEAVPIHPCGIDRVVPQMVVPEHLGNVRHPHRHPRMAGSCALYRVHGQRANRVGEFSA